VVLFLTAFLLPAPARAEDRATVGPGWVSIESKSEAFPDQLFAKTPGLNYRDLAAVECLVLHPDGNRRAVAGRGSGISLLDLDLQLPTVSLGPFESGCSYLRFSQDGALEETDDWEDGWSVSLASVRRKIADAPRTAGASREMGYEPRSST